MKLLRFLVFSYIIANHSCLKCFILTKLSQNVCLINNNMSKCQMWLQDMDYFLILLRFLRILYKIVKYSCLKYFIFFLMNINILIKSHARCVCKLWDVQWFYWFFWYFPTLLTTIHICVECVLNLHQNFTDCVPNQHTHFDMLTCQMLLQVSSLV